MARTSTRESNDVAEPTGAPLSTARISIGELAFPVRYTDGSALALLACAAGRELWGFPMYLTRIDTEFTRDAVEVILGEELVIEHRARFGMTMPAPPYAFFSELEDRVIRTVVPVEHKLRMGGARSVLLHVTGDGPTSAIVRRLGLEKRHPMMAARSDHLAFTLPLGTQVGFAPLRIA